MRALNATSKDPSVRSIRLLLFAVLIAAGCSPSDSGPASTPTPTDPPAAPTAADAPTVEPTVAQVPTEIPPAPPGDPARVMFVQDGNILVWDEATNQTETLFDAGDVIAVTLSDDAQVIAFLRRSIVTRGDNDWFEQSALWAMDRNGENPREIVSADSLRGRLSARENDSTNIAQMAWIPGTHRLLFTGRKYIVQGEGESHAVPEGLYQVDVDTRSDTWMVPAGNPLRFVPSPDGMQIALMSPTGLSFVNINGSNFRQNVLTYPEVGVPVRLFPTGVWVEDSSAFVVTGFLGPETDSGFDFTIWRVPADGAAPEPLAEVVRSHPGSVTFSPDGQRVGFIQYTEEQPAGVAGWFITFLKPAGGPLDVPQEIEFGYASLHWSPAGQAFMGDLQELCQDATQGSDVCSNPVSFQGTAAMIHWLDSARFLFLTREPFALHLARLDPANPNAGTTVQIAEWPAEALVGPQSVSAALVAPGQ